MRTKSFHRFSLALIGLLLVALVAAGPAIGAKKMKSKEIAELYKSSCKACHGPESETGELSPASLIQSQWKRFFDKKYEKTHADLVHPEQDKPLKEVLPPEMLKTLKKWIVDHAADSEQPMTCGK